MIPHWAHLPDFYTYFDTSTEEEVMGPTHNLSDISSLALAQAKEKTSAYPLFFRSPNEAPAMSTTPQAD